jgi:copper transporter 1
VMACGFSSSTVVAVWFGSWTTSGGASYGLALAAVFALGVALEGLRRANIWAARALCPTAAELRRWSATQRATARAGRAAVHVAMAATGYLLMLAVMSYNAGLFAAALAGMGAGFVAFAPETRDQEQEEMGSDAGDGTGCH